MLNGKKPPNFTRELSPMQYGDQGLARLSREPPRGG